MVGTISRLTLRAIIGWLFAAFVLWVQFRFGLAAAYIGAAIPAYPSLRLEDSRLVIQMLVSAFWVLPLGFVLPILPGLWRPAIAVPACTYCWVIGADDAAYLFQMDFGTTWRAYEPFWELVFTPALTLPCLTLLALVIAALHWPPRLGRATP